MVKHTSATTARTTDKSTRSDQASLPKTSSRHDDDIILSLSNAYENKRARQVTEWERVQATRWHQRAA